MQQSVKAKNGGLAFPWGEGVHHTGGQASARGTLPLDLPALWFLLVRKACLSLGGGGAPPWCMLAVWVWGTVCVLHAGSLGSRSWNLVGRLSSSFLGVLQRDLGLGGPLS